MPRRGGAARTASPATVGRRREDASWWEVAGTGSGFRSRAAALNKMRTATRAAPRGPAFPFSKLFSRLVLPVARRTHGPPPGPGIPDFSVPRGAPDYGGAHRGGAPERTMSSGAGAAVTAWRLHAQARPENARARPTRAHGRAVMAFAPDRCAAHRSASPATAPSAPKRQGSSGIYWDFVAGSARPVACPECLRPARHSRREGKPTRFGGSYR